MWQCAPGDEGERVHKQMDRGEAEQQRWQQRAQDRMVCYLKVKATGDQIEVGFFGWVARVAHVHQFGHQERVSKKGPFTNTRHVRY